MSVSADERVPLLLTDIQQLLIHVLLGNSIIYQPLKWYVLEKICSINKTMCLVLEGISLENWVENKTMFAQTSKLFDDVVEVITPCAYGGSLIEELAAVPISEMEKESLLKKYGDMNLALECRKDLMMMMRAVFPINTENKTGHIDADIKDQFSRTHLLLSAQQLIEENYPLPLKGKLRSVYSDYVMSKDTYQPVTPQSPMFAVDCEMCMTQAGSELTRISVVNEEYETVYEHYVKPYNDVTNYLTHFSGVDEAKLEHVTKRLEDVQNDLKELLPDDAILVGQSLNADLQALKMMHPYIIDTSVIFNFTGVRSRKPKLKSLARELLNEIIQEDKSGHCSIEDALACMKLVKLKLSNSIEFGDAVLRNKKSVCANRLKDMKEESQCASTIFNHLIQQKKKCVIIGCDNITGDYHSYLTRANEYSISQSLSTKGKPKKVKLCTVDDENNVLSTIGESVLDYDFIISHIKVEINDDNVEKVSQISSIDNFIKVVHDTLEDSTFFVVIFSGTTTHNGVAMVRVKKC